MKQTFLLISLPIIMGGSVFSTHGADKCEVRIEWGNAKQTIAANGINFEGYHTAGATEVAAPRFEEMMAELPCQLNRLSMPLKVWEPANDNDDPRAMDFGNFNADVKVVNTFLIMKELKNKKIGSWLSVWDLPDWNVLNPGEKNQRRVRNVDEMAESITSFLLYGKKNFGTEPLYVSVNEPTVAAENGWGGYSLILTPSEQTELIKKSGKLFDKHGIETRWLVGLHKVYPSELEQAKTIYSDPEVKKYIAGFDFHGYGLQTKENEPLLRAWGEWAGSTGLITLVGEADYDSSFWLKEERGHWNDASDKYSALLCKLLNTARVNGIMPWYGNVPFQNYPYRFVSKQYMEAFPAGTRIFASSSSCDKLHVTAGRKGGKGTVVIYNSADTPVTIVLRDNKNKMYRHVSSRDKIYMVADTVYLRNGLLELSLPAKSLHTFSFKK